MKKTYTGYTPKNPPYKSCPHCGANLDSGERCDCRAARAERATPPKPPRMAAGQ